MPGFDGRGPSGRGAMTGRGLGRCSAAQSPAREPVTGDQPVSMRDSAQTAVYGLGQGGAPRGCGKGNRRGRFRSAYNRQQKQG